MRRLSRLEITRLTPRTVLLSVGRQRHRVQQLAKDSWLVRQQSRSGDVLVDRTYAEQLSLLKHVAEEHIAWVLRRLKINCVLDVGANRGQYAKRLRRAGYTGRIVSFEPLPGVAARLKKAAARDPEWRVFRCALGQERGETEMSIAGGQARMSSLLPPSDFGKSWAAKLRGDSETAPVSIRRLDELFAEAIAGITEPRVYLKLDTQGYDLQAFAGAGDCIQDVIGMQSEVSSVQMYEGMPRLTEQIATYESAGFALTGMFPVIVDRPTLRVIEFDAVMIRADALGK